MNTFVEHSISNMKNKGSLSDQDIKIYLSILSAAEQLFDLTLPPHSLDTSFSFLLGDDRKKMEQLFCSLVVHWDITSQLTNEDLPEGKEFDQFPTIQHLLTFLSDKVQKC